MVFVAVEVAAADTLPQITLAEKGAHNRSEKATEIEWESFKIIRRKIEWIPVFGPGKSSYVRADPKSLVTGGNLQLTGIRGTDQKRDLAMPEASLCDQQDGDMIISSGSIMYRFQLVV